MPKFDPTIELSDHDAMVLILYILENWQVIIRPHAKMRMSQRGYSDQDVLHVLETGLIKNKEFDSTRGSWKYRVEGEDIDGDDGVVITAIVSSSQQVIITVF